MFYYKKWQVMIMILISFTITLILISTNTAQAFDVVDFPLVDDIVYDTRINNNDTLFVYKKNLVSSEINELREERTINSQKFKTEIKDQYKIKIYSSPQFIKDISGYWYNLEYKIASTTDFELEYLPVWDIIEEIRAFFYNPFMLNNIANALATSTFAYNDNNTTWGNDATWSIARDTEPSPQMQNDPWVTCQYNSGAWNVARTFFNFDTSYLEITDTIISAELFTYGFNTSNYDNDGLDYISIVEHNQVDPENLATSDFHNETDIELHETSERIDITSMTIPAYQSWQLNSTGINVIDINGYTQLMLREGHDLENTSCNNSTGHNSYFSYGSDETGTDKDPYLLISYTVASSSPATTTTETDNASATFLELISNLIPSNDITLITWYEETITGTSTITERKNGVAHIPLIWLLIIGLAIIYLFTFIYWQIQHRLENKKLLK